MNNQPPPDAALGGCCCFVIFIALVLVLIWTIRRLKKSKCPRCGITLRTRNQVYCQNCGHAESRT